MPDLLTGYLDPPPQHRPVGLRRRRIVAGTELWRIDASAPDDWRWDGYPEPRHRFDPASGTFRVRYAGRSIAGAARERYLVTGLYVPGDHAQHHLVRLVPDRDLRVLDLRSERNLDALGVDDQISTGQHPAVLDTCHLLADRVGTWWGDLDALVYRARTTPATSISVAFFATDAFTVEAWQLAERVDVLTDLTLRHGFALGWTLPGP